MICSTRIDDSWTVLVINSGSSSIKYALLAMTNEQKLAGGLIEKIGEGFGTVTHYSQGHPGEQD